MGIPVLILGESGTGKSTSMRNFKNDEIGIINVASKPLPFRTKLKTFNSDDYEKIEQVLRRAKTKSIVIDDAQYLQANEFMRNANDKGYQKFTDIAYNFWNLMQTIRFLPDDVIVYIMAHTETTDSGKEKFKTVGKLTDNYSVEGLCTIVLKTLVKDGKYLFTTQNNGNDTVKSPIGLFKSTEIENDLKMVDNAIREYYFMNESEDTNNEKT